MCYARSSWQLDLKEFEARKVKVSPQHSKTVRGFYKHQNEVIEGLLASQAEAHGTGEATDDGGA